MKSKIFIIVIAFYLSYPSVLKAQTTLPKGKVKLVEFTNANAKFTVPPGKTWYIYQVLSFAKIKEENINVFIKSINNTELTNLSIEKLGPKIYDPVNIYMIPLPIIFPENTSFSLIITSHKDGSNQTVSDKNAFINYIEITN